MDFFTAQDRARRKSAILVVYFLLAVVAIILSLYFTISMFLRAGREYELHRVEAYRKPVPWWDAERFLRVAGSVVLVVGVSSLYKIAELSQGGGSVARALGGRRIDPTTRKPEERRLVNLVEEMSIASGVPIPEIYILDQEEAINAFAAGHKWDDAAVAVTRGALQKLSRDELQGVIAHEFSHILNGDMRLNLRLAGVIFGILVIGIIGRLLLESLRYTRTSSREKGGGLVAALFLLGLAIMIIGYCGTFFGRLIQAAVSRQREFLADAAAVQFTRNPLGIAGALKKIGGLTQKARIHHAGASGYAHFFFADALGSSLAALFATHPPLEERIKVLDPQFDGTFTETPARLDLSQEGLRGASQPAAAMTASAIHRPAINQTGSVPTMQNQIRFTNSLGTLSSDGADYASRLLQQLPGAIREAATDPCQAQAVILALLLTEDPSNRAAGIAYIRKHAPREVSGPLGYLFSPVQARPAWEKLPILELMLPTLKDYPRPEKEAIFEWCEALVLRDRRTSLFEFALLAILRQRFQLGFPNSARLPLAAAGSLLSAVARLAAPDSAKTEQLFREKVSASMALSKIDYRPEEDYFQLLEAIQVLAQTEFAFRRLILETAEAMVCHDRRVTVEEAEIFRTISLALEIPCPPLAPTFGV